MSDEHLLLRIRAESLLFNLGKLEDVLIDAPNRQSKLASLSQQLDRSLVHAKQVLSSINDWVEDAKDDKAPAQAALQTAAEQMKATVQQLREAREDLKLIKQMSFPEGGPIGSEISTDLKRRIGPALVELGEVKRLLANGRPFDAESSWHTFYHSAIVPSRKIFSEYIDLLGGIALRDAQFDAGICQVADELIRTFHPTEQSGGRLRVIPARNEAVGMTLARIIRLRFPDWTIWALPFTAHELWDIEADESLEMRLINEIRSLSGRSDAETIAALDRVCLADAFATYMMGPAYAYATVILLLEPCTAFECGDDRLADEVRAHVILKMLEQMDTNYGPLGALYDDIRKDLQAAWNAAKEQAGTSPGDKGERIAADIKRADILVTALWTVLEEVSGAPLTPEAWNQVVDLKKDLLAGESTKLPQGAELRQVLNAAWLARVDSRPDSVDSQRDSKVDLTDAAFKLAEKIIQRNATPAPGRRVAARGIA